jgi:hypothetical protein
MEVGMAILAIAPYVGKHQVDVAFLASHARMHAA